MRLKIIGKRIMAFGSSGGVCSVFAVVFEIIADGFVNDVILCNWLPDDRNFGRMHLGMLGCGHCLTYFNGITKEFWLTVEHIHVKYAFDSGKEFSYVGDKKIIFRHRSIESHRIDAVMPGYIQGSFVMKTLTNDGDTLLFKDVFNAHHTVQGAESGIIKINSFGGNPQLQQIRPHGTWFIVGFFGIVTRYYNVIDFTVVIQLESGVYPVDVVLVDFTLGNVFRGAENQPGAVVGDFFNVVVGVGGTCMM